VLARLVLASVFVAAGLIGCDRDPPDLREWRLSDHDHTSNPNSDQVEVDQNDAGAGGMLGISEVIVVAWRQNCVTCHGTIGRGDGPQGRMLRATDLTKPDWQSGITDENIARVIRTGKGTMPAFNLPDTTVEGLVRLIRLLDASRYAEAAAAAASGAPATSGAPNPSSAPATSGPAKKSAPSSSVPAVSRQPATGAGAPSAVPPR